MTASVSETPGEDSAVDLPSLVHTALGYEYIRDRVDGDETVYLQQLTACVEYDPHAVFHPDSQVRFHIDVPWLVYPENLEVEIAGKPVPRDAEVPESERRSVSGLTRSEYERLSA